MLNVLTGSQLARPLSCVQLPCCVSWNLESPIRFCEECDFVNTNFQPSVIAFSFSESESFVYLHDCVNGNFSRYPFGPVIQAVRVPPVKWTPLSRPFLVRNKLMLGGVLGLSLGRRVRPADYPTCGHATDFSLASPDWLSTRIGHGFYNIPLTCARFRKDEMVAASIVTP
jgi:hypothetical protein